MTRSVWWITWCVLLMAGPLMAQAPDAKIGLALSGGGAKGLAHVGVLKVLEEAGVPIDYIAGTSMGSVVGGLYATGYDPERLERMAVDTDWDLLFSDGPDRRVLSMEEKRRDGRYIVSLPLRNWGVGLPTELIDGQRVVNLLTRLTWPVHHVRDFKTLPIPFVSVATDIETGEAVALDKGHLPHAMLASMAIPTALTPIEINGRLLVDGGVARNLPAEDVRNMGADYVICVNVSTPLETREKLNSLTSILNQTIGFGVWNSIAEQEQECDLLIKPDIGDYSTLDFDEGEALIELGETATRAKLDTLQTLAATLNREAAPPVGPPGHAPDSVWVHTVEVIGTNEAGQSMVQNQIELVPPSWMTVDILELEVARIYSTKYFKQVVYRLDTDADGAKLVFQVVEQQDNQVQLGFRYDQRREAAFVFNARFRNAFTPGGRAGLELILGERTELSADYFLPIGVRKQYGLLGIVNYTNRSFDVFDNGDRFAELRFLQLSAEATIGSYLNDYGIYAGGLRIEQALVSPRIAPPDFSEFREDGVTLLMPVARVWFDTQNRSVYPTAGHSLFIESVGTSEKFGSEVSMSQHQLLLDSAFPLHPRWTLRPDIEAGLSYGEIPSHRVLTLGGLNQTPFVAGRFYGLKPDEIAGPFTKKLGMALQYALTGNRYLIFTGNVGSVADRWYWTLKGQRIWGGAATFGIITPIGPAELSVSHSTANTFLYDINIGFRF